MWNVGLDESQVGIKISWRNINSLRHAVYTTLMTESEEELKSLLDNERGEWKRASETVKEENEKAGLKLSIQKAIIMPLVPSFHGK